MISPSKVCGHRIGSILVLAVLASGCGDSLEPSGGRNPAAQVGAAGVGDPSPESKPKSSDGIPAAPAFPELMNDAMIACHAQGTLYDRRQGECSATYRLVGDAPCDRSAVRDLFASTGFQIDQILDRSLGREGVSGEVGDGYVIDQCGKSATHVLALLVRKDESGRYLVRELEAKWSAAPLP